MSLLVAPYLLQLACTVPAEGPAEGAAPGASARVADPIATAVAVDMRAFGATRSGFGFVNPGWG
ncbi:MAG: hypothetical protein FJ102_18220, partial [Deltaproteobacteria bacterium]|nr:hypothetical protein [Deltaproteobacteria bacterium]